MEAEVLGIDHIYLSVRSLGESEVFYDALLADILGFKKSVFSLADRPHLNYYNRQFGFVIRPARVDSGPHDPDAPGLHHFCLRVTAEVDVDRVASALVEKGIGASPPRYYREYAADYYATFVADPDGIRLEVTNFRAERAQRMNHWDGERPRPFAVKDVPDPPSNDGGSTA